MNTMNNEKDYINIIAQALYSNRMNTRIHKDNVDRLILGYTGNELKVTEPIDRTIIKLPIDENIVIVYNKYSEEESRKYKEEVFKEKNYEVKPTAIIDDIVLYSRCIACRMNDNGELESLQNGDYNKIVNYLTE